MNFMNFQENSVKMRKFERTLREKNKETASLCKIVYLVARNTCNFDIRALPQAFVEERVKCIREYCAHTMRLNVRKKKIRDQHTHDENTYAMHTHLHSLLYEHLGEKSLNLPKASCDSIKSRSLSSHPCSYVLSREIEIGERKRKQMKEKLFFSCYNFGKRTHACFPFLSLATRTLRDEVLRDAKSHVYRL